jgi:hypothetical protein
VACDSYRTLDEAKLLLAKEFNVQDFVPENNQLKLWN